MLFTVFNPSDVESLRQERQTSEEEARNLSSRSREMMDLNLKLQATSTKSLAKAIDFELRKEHAVEAEEQLNIVKVRIIRYKTNLGVPPGFIRIRTLVNPRTSQV